MRRHWGSGLCLVFPLCALACTEDRCSDSTRGLLDDTPQFHGCNHDQAFFRPSSFHLGADGLQTLDGGKAKKDGGIDGRDLEHVAVFFTDAAGMARPAAQVYVFECEPSNSNKNPREQAVPTGMVELVAAPGCDLIRDGTLSCVTNDQGYASFEVLRVAGTDGTTHLCASESASGASGVNLGTATIAIQSGITHPSSLEIAFSDPAVPTLDQVQDAGSMPPAPHADWLVPASLSSGMRCVIEPQLVNCQADAVRTVAFQTQLEGHAGLTDAGGSLLVADQKVTVTLSISTLSGGSGWLSKGDCQGVHYLSVLATVDPGSSASEPVQLCVGPAGGKFAITAVADGPARAKTTIFVEPAEYVAVLAQPKEAAGDAATSASFDARLVSPCGGNTNGVHATVSASVNSGSLVQARLSGDQARTLTVAAQQGATVTVNVVRDNGAQCLSQSLNVAGAMQ